MGPQVHIAILLSCLCLTGCAVPVASGPLFSPPPPDPPHGLIYVYRPQHSPPSSFRLFANRQFVGKLYVHGYLPIVVGPGEPTVSLTDEIDKFTDAHGYAVDVYVPPGEVMFVRLTVIEIPNPFHRTVDYRLCLVDQREGLNDLPNMRLSDSTTTVWYEPADPVFDQKFRDCYRRVP